MANDSFVSWVRVRADAVVLHDFGPLADAGLSFGVVHPLVDDSHFARAEGWERIEQRVVANICPAHGGEFYCDNGSWNFDGTEGRAEWESGVPVPGGGSDYTDRAGFIGDCAVANSWS